jgi:hypothetical protein
MARSSATLKPGDRLALRHGAYSLKAIEARLPAIRERLEAELAQVPYITPPDESLKRAYCFVVAQRELMEQYFETHGGLLTLRGSPKKGAFFMLQLIDRQEKLARALGLGALARAQTFHDLSAGRRNQADVEGRYQRMRAKQRLAIVGDA